MTQKALSLCIIAFDGALPLHFQPAAAFRKAVFIIKQLTNKNSYLLPRLPAPCPALCPARGGALWEVAEGRGSSGGGGTLDGEIPPPGVIFFIAEGRSFGGEGGVSSSSSSSLLSSEGGRRAGGLVVGTGGGGGLGEGVRDSRGVASFESPSAFSSSAGL